MTVLNTVIILVYALIRLHGFGVNIFVLAELRLTAYFPVVGNYKGKSPV